MLEDRICFCLFNSYFLNSYLPNSLIESLTFDKSSLYEDLLTKIAELSKIISLEAPHLSIYQLTIEENNQILLGHHSDDAAETILMRLLRGTGVEGLNGIKMKRKLGSGILIRPFLDISKKEILNYLKDHDINYIEDDSNKINDFDRNFLRNEIFPLLDNRWSNFAQRINTMSHIIQERNVNYTNLFMEKHGELVGHKIDINKLKTLQESLIIDVLRYSIKACNLAVPNSKIMKEIVKTFINSDPGPKSQVSWSRSDKEEPGGSVTYKKGFLLISKK